MVSSGARNEMLQNKGYYNNLLRNYPKEMPSIYEKAIDDDIPRTFHNLSDEILYSKKLKHILIAYSRRNISIGYCQGFNFIAGFILKTVHNEEEAFWLFVQIIESILPLNYFSNAFGVLVDSALISELIKEYLPDMYVFIHNKGFEVHITNLLYKWLLSLFVESFNEKLTLLIWDVLFLEGDIAIFKAALGILKWLKNDIVQSKSFDDITVVFNNKINTLNDSSRIVYLLLLRRYEFNRSHIRKARIKFEKEVKKTFKFRSNSNRLSNSFTVEECDPTWNLCTLDPYIHDEIQNFVVLKRDEEINIIDNYYEDTATNSRSKPKSYSKSRKDLWKGLLINRREHYCVNNRKKYEPIYKKALTKNISINTIISTLKKNKSYISLNISQISPL